MNLLTFALASTLAVSTPIQKTGPALVAPKPVEASPTELAFWNSIQSNPQREDFEAYLLKFPNGVFADLARNRIKRLAALSRSIPPTGRTGASGSAPRGGDPEVVIGGVAPMTGEAATFGISCKNGFDLAIGEWNAKGGLLGKPIRLAMADDRGDPAEGAGVFRDLILNEQVTAIIGPVMSKVSLAGAPICQAAEVPMIAATATNPRVTQVGDYIFRACFIDPFQGVVGAKFAYENLRTRKAACLFDVGNDYTQGMSATFKTAYLSMGGQIVAFEGHATGTTDFRELLKRVLASRPEILYVSDYYNDVALIARQARELGFKGPLLGGDGWDSPKLPELAGKAIEGCFFTNHYVPGDPSPAVRMFVQAYRAKYAEEPDALSILGYDSACLMFEAIQRAGSLEGPAIRNSLAATDTHLATGRITFDANRNPVKSAVICEVKGGRFVYRATINP